MFREHLRVSLLIAVLSLSPTAHAQTPEPPKNETKTPETSTQGANITSEKPELKKEAKEAKEKKVPSIAKSKVPNQPSEILYFISSPTLDTSKEGVVLIDATRAPGAFKSLRVKNVGENELNLTGMQIVYNDGTVHNEDRPINIKKGERTRKIAETPNDKFIDKITLSWKATGGQTKLQVIGYQTPEARKLQRSSTALSLNIQNPSTVPFPRIGPIPNQPTSQEAGPPSPEGTITPLIILPESPIFFASHKIDLSIDGNVTIDTTRTAGAFRSVRIRNNGDNSIDLSGVQIVYNDGTVHNEDRLINIKKGERTRKIAETPNDKFIDKITLSWKATGGQTKLQIIGYQTSEGRKLQRSSTALSQNIQPSPLPIPQIGPMPNQPTSQGMGPPEGTITPLIILPESPIFFASPKIDLSIDGNVTIDTTRTAGAFRSVRIRNKGGIPIDLTGVQIVYNDGTVHNEDRPINIKKGERTRKIAETPNDKFIDKITLSWKATGGQTKLQIIGYQTSEGRKLQRSSTALSQNIQNLSPLPIPQIGPMPNQPTSQLISQGAASIDTVEETNQKSEPPKNYLEPMSPSLSSLPPGPPSDGPDNSTNKEIAALNPANVNQRGGPQAPTATTDLGTTPTLPSTDQTGQDGTANTPPTIPLTNPENKDISYAGDELLLAYQNISLSIERHNIKISPDIGKIAHIRFGAFGSDLKITSLKVLYRDDSFQDITLNADIKDQMASPWIELHGDKLIREIEYNNQTKKNSKDIVRIEILGQHVKGWLVENSEAKKFNQGWMLLGAKTTSFKNIDKDTFKIAENDGGFTKLKIIAKDRPLTLREIRVIFFSGPDEVFTIKDRLDPQKPYGPLEFKGVRSAIKEIQVKYRARIDLANSLSNVIESAPAIVELWGQY